MAKRNDEAHPISPPPVPQIETSPVSLPPTLSLPGTTDEAPFQAPLGRWRARLRGRLSALTTTRGVDARLKPYLARAEERADAAIGEILQTAGACGPIAETQAVLGARFAEFAHFFLDHADPTTKRGRGDVLLARACADTSRLNLDGALKTAVAIARATPPSREDPLEKHLEPPTLDVEPEES